MNPIVEFDESAAKWVAKVGSAIVAQSERLGEVCEAADRISREGHISTDQRIMHCPFCGSGEIYAKSDGTTQCNLCHRAFYCSEQSPWAAMPSPQTMSQTIDGGPQAAGEPTDPTEQALQSAPSFTPPELPPAPVPPAEDPIKPTGVRTDSGIVVSEADAAMHLAVKYLRD